MHAGLDACLHFKSMEIQESNGVCIRLNCSCMAADCTTRKGYRAIGLQAVQKVLFAVTLSQHKAIGRPTDCFFLTRQQMQREEEDTVLLAEQEITARRRAQSTNWFTNLSKSLRSSTVQVTLPQYMHSLVYLPLNIASFPESSGHFASIHAFRSLLHSRNRFDPRQLRSFCLNMFYP